MLTYLFFTIFTMTPTYALDPIDACEPSLSSLATPPAKFELSGPHYERAINDGRKKSLILQTNGVHFAELIGDVNRRNDIWVTAGIRWNGRVSIFQLRQFLRDAYDGRDGVTVDSELWLRGIECIRGPGRPLSEALDWGIYRWFVKWATSVWLPARHHNRPTILTLSANSHVPGLESLQGHTDLVDREGSPSVGIRFRPDAMKDPQFRRALNTLVRASAPRLKEALVHDFYRQIETFYDF